MQASDAPANRARFLPKVFGTDSPLRERIARGTLAFAVVGLGPHPSAPDGLTIDQRAARVVDIVASHGARCFGGFGSYGGEREPCIIIFGATWPVEVAKQAGRAANQETIFSHVPGTACNLIYTDGSGRGRVPLGNLKRGPNPDGDYTDIGGERFHA